jgi:glucose-1-phosphate cytidylyltransferase
VRPFLEGEEAFLANYADGLSDLPLDRMVEEFQRKRVVASFAAVAASQSFHVVQAGTDGLVESLGPMHGDALLVNGGFFALRREIFDYVHEGEELVEQPFQRLIEKRLLGSYRHPGFWQAMDTFKDKITLDRMEARGECPWMVWRADPSRPFP